ncbi:peptidyl-alpha-hydroxyglycine alpha-amidating lyase family protein [Schlesneria paludicola]|uniref:peptidyl-alpha-hydroxyglycine alpha-amidating lyase family protein n=1 Tax=Schlesneria paludicola TaxID=360056 RepID=UPI000299E1D9|nr:peptidyl-alpha-hydroxyglycine alpha-amidating lyase family protein [Schlesneria paludicola]
MIVCSFFDRCFVRNAFFVLSLLAVALIAAPTWAAKDDDPVVTEFDVDPAWPKRPDHVSGKGWVSGLAVDAQDQVWFFRKGPDPVQVYTADGEFVRTWGKEQFLNPHQMRIDPEGNVWVADFGLHVVQKFSPEGKVLMVLGTRGEKGQDETHFNMPTDMVVTPAGDIFVTDGYGNRRVVHFTKEGQYVKTFGAAGPNPGQFVLPHAIVVDSKGVLYIADRNSGRIQLFDQDGKFLDQWSNVLMPWGLSVTKDDQLWVCGSSPHWWYRHGVYPEYKDQVFMRFATNGRVLQTWMLPLGDIGTNKDVPDTSRLKPGETVGAHCIAQDSKGNVYVGDIYGERAQKFVPISKR